MRLFNTSLVLLLFFISCEKTEDTSSLFDSNWKVAGIVTELLEEKFPEHDYILRMMGDTSYSINLDVNNCFGTLDIEEPNRVMFSFPGCTEACCDTEFAIIMLDLLAHTESYAAIENELILTGKGKIRLRRE